MKQSDKEKEALRKNFKQNNFLGSEEYTEAVVNYWLSKIDSILEKKEKDIVEMIEKRECFCNDDRGAGLFKNGHFQTCPQFNPNGYGGVQEL